MNQDLRRFSVTLGIDFTKSNGSRRLKSSFHHLSSKKGKSNLYQKAVKIVEEVFDSVSKTQLSASFDLSSPVYQVYGFGALWDYSKDAYFDEDDDPPEPLDQFLLHSSKTMLSSSSDVLQVRLLCCRRPMTTSKLDIDL